MKIKNQFQVPLPLEEAWVILNDIPRVAHCAPGAELVEAQENGDYVGIVRVKLGPVALSFKGTLSYKERDADARRVVAEASGAEERARGSARANVVFNLSAIDEKLTRVNVDTDVQLAGSIAQYGRGTALMQSTAQVLMNQFAKNFAASFGAGADPDAVNRKAAPVSALSLTGKALVGLAKSKFERSETRGSKQ